MSRIAVVIPTAGRDDLLLACLRSLRPNPETWAGAVLVNNAGEFSYETAEAIKTIGLGMTNGFVLPDMRSLATLWNFGLQLAFQDYTADYVLVLNDDVEMPLGWDRQLMPRLDTHPDKMCVCLPDRLTLSTLLPAFTPEWAEAQSGVPEAARWGHRKWTVAPGVIDAPVEGSPYPHGFEEYANSFWNLSDERSWAPCSMNGAAFVLRRSVWESGFRFDPDFSLCFEDQDAWLRLLEAYGPDRIGSFMRVFVHHWRASTIGAIPGAQERIDRSKLHFQKKWAGREDLVAWFSTVNATPLGVPWPEPPGNAPWRPWNRAKGSWDGWQDRDIETEVKP